MEWGSAAYTAATLVCAAAASVVALTHIYRHLLHYAEPIYQRFIVRIIFLVPVTLSARRSHPQQTLVAKGALAPDLSPAFAVAFPYRMSSRGTARSGLVSWRGSHEC
ncbi:hypothetical protein Zm00014a_028074 [Zea mays]|uniref:Uncharacterized protein n=1 Tax=Zea mays TaxID=4577 RepID=A0A3L6ELH7_MAIZE|nr:hypothetical protein Zm00014a_028074 [Zea mays]